MNNNFTQAPANGQQNGWIPVPNWQPFQNVPPPANQPIPNFATLSALGPLPAIAPPPALAPPLALAPLYQLNARNPRPGRFAMQFPGPHSVHNPPPPAPNLAPSISAAGSNNGAQLHGKPPGNAQPPMQTLGPNPAITIEEIMRFCAGWLQSPEVAMRAVRNGSTIPQLIDMFFGAAGAPAREEEIASKRIRKQMSLAADAAIDVGGPAFGFQGKKARNDLGPQADLTAAAWELYGDYVGGPRRPVDFVHVRLSDFWATVPLNHWPTGVAAGVMTRCLLFAFINPHLNLDTSHWEWIIQTQGY
ncbi:hypothetical protein LTR15_002420 [Elasticomyces elasticus]|nr:hypothetical protein LTR15_002420 [Elasticomyces elasticus]